MPKWSKEDRHHYNNSEVMIELEKLIFERYESLKNIQENINKQAQNKVEQIATDATTANKAIQELGKSITELDNANEDMEPTKIRIEEDEDSEEDIVITQAAIDETIDHLKKMANKALEINDYKSLYEIERTIQEIRDGQNEEE